MLTLQFTTTLLQLAVVHDITPYDIASLFVQPPSSFLRNITSDLANGTHPCTEQVSYLSITPRALSPGIPSIMEENKRAMSPFCLDPTEPTQLTDKNSNHSQKTSNEINIEAPVIESWLIQAEKEFLESFVSRDTVFENIASSKAVKMHNFLETRFTDQNQSQDRDQDQNQNQEYKVESQHEEIQEYQRHGSVFVGGKRPRQFWNDSTLSPVEISKLRHDNGFSALSSSTNENEDEHGIRESMCLLPLAESCFAKETVIYFDGEHSRSINRDSMNSSRVEPRDFPISDHLDQLTSKTDPKQTCSLCIIVPESPISSDSIPDCSNGNIPCQTEVSWKSIQHGFSILPDSIVLSREGRDRFIAFLQSFLDEKLGFLKKRGIFPVQQKFRSETV